MERSISIDSWEEVQRHGQGIADRLNSLAQGLGCMLQSHIRTSAGVCASPPRAQKNPGWGMKINLPWPFGEQPLRSPQPSFDIHKPPVVQLPPASLPLYDLGNRLGQAGAELSAFVGGFVGNFLNQFQKAPVGLSSGFVADRSSPTFLSAGVVSSSFDEETMSLEWKEKDDSNALLLSSCVSSKQSRRSEEPPAANDSPSGFEASNDELAAAIAKSSSQFHKQSSITVTTTYDSRTQDIETSVVARGDLWRAEASHGGASSSSSSNGSSPLFLLQIGPILFVRDTTLLLPIHLSKRHLLWYGFDRKNGLHSLCPAIWSKHRRWLLMSMVCLNPVACSFMDLQFPNGQMTYVAGEGLSGSAFVPVCGGLLQVQGRHPGESKLSFSFKNLCGTRVCPSLHLPEKSVSVGVTQPLAWQRSGVMLRPTIQLSVTPTFGGRNAGWRAEVVHSPKEKLSVACGCSLTLEPSAFASISVGRSKRNGEHTGSSGLVLQVETPLENFRRASFSLQLNSGVEF